MCSVLCIFVVGAQQLLPVYYHQTVVEMLNKSSWICLCHHAVIVFGIPAAVARQSTQPQQRGDAQRHTPQPWVQCHLG